VAEVVAILTMIVGNVLAMRQDNVKRMLAYSAIAHSGYLLLAFLLQINASTEEMAGNVQSIIFYLLVYGVMTLGAFGVVALTRENGQPLEDIGSFKGLAKESPAVALCMATFMLSLAGMPPLGGFFAKFMIFSNAVNQGFIAAAVIGILTSVASLYYYLRVVVAMYMSPANDSVSTEPAAKAEYVWGAALLIYVTGVATLLLGLLPGVVMNAWMAGGQ
jgi:NADH-quinone oxidoreductase subunit N